MTSSLWLHTDRLSVEVRPDKGADITSITERATGIDILFRTPWGRRDLAGAPVTGDSRTDWLARYGGGWQQLVPHAAPSAASTASAAATTARRRSYPGRWSTPTTPGPSWPPS